MLNASLLSLPGAPPDTTRPPPPAPPAALEPDAPSSREPETDQPEEEPVRRMGWQSCPAAMMDDSEMKVRER